MDHLRRKLMIRNPLKYKSLEQVKKPSPHPVFKSVIGTVEEWEIIKNVYPEKVKDNTTKVCAKSLKNARKEHKESEI